MHVALEYSHTYVQHTDVVIQWENTVLHTKAFLSSCCHHQNSNDCTLSTLVQVVVSLMSVLHSEQNMDIPFRAEHSLSLTNITSGCFSLPRPPLPFEPVKDKLPLLQHEWVRDFLLTQSEDGERHAMSSPYPLKNASVGRMTSAASTFSGETAKLRGMNLIGTWVVMPSLVVDRITTAYIIEENIDSSVEPSKPELNVLRMAFRDTDGHGVCMRHDEQKGLTEVLLMAIISSTYQQRHLFQFDTKLLREAYSKGSSPNLLTLANALRHSESYAERRICPVCRLSSDLECECKLDFSHASHPFDFSQFSKNLFAHAGDFSGFCLWNDYLNGFPVSSKQVLTFTSVVGDADQETVDRMVRWATEKYVGARYASVLRSHLSSSLFNSFVADMHARALSPVTADEPTAFQVPVQALQHSAKARDSALDGLLQGPGFIPGQQQVPHSAALAAQKLSAPLPITAREAGQNASGVLLENSAVAAAPGMHKIAPAGGSVDTQKQEESGTDNLVYRRILRNRESAARCNQRKQLRLEQLKRSLADLQKREAALRDRESALRDENARLRATVIK